MDITEFISSHYIRCVRWAKSCLPPEYRQEAEDVVMETYISFRDNPKILHEATAQTYIFRAIKNKAIDYMRSKATQGRLRDDYENLIRSQIFENGDNSDPSELVDADLVFNRRVETLSPLLRSTLESVAILGESPEELAEQENVSAAVIYKRMERAKKTLRGE